MKNKPLDRNTMLTAAPACLQAPETNPATCVAVGVDVWCRFGQEEAEDARGVDSAGGDCLIRSDCDLSERS